MSETIKPVTTAMELGTALMEIAELAGLDEEQAISWGTGVHLGLELATHDPEWGQKAVDLLDGDDEGPKLGNLVEVILKYVVIKPEESSDAPIQS